MLFSVIGSSISCITHSLNEALATISLRDRILLNCYFDRRLKLLASLLFSHCLSQQGIDIQQSGVGDFCLTMVELPSGSINKKASQCSGLGSAGKKAESQHFFSPKTRYFKWCTGIIPITDLTAGTIPGQRSDPHQALFTDGKDTANNHTR